MATLDKFEVEQALKTLNNWKSKAEVQKKKQIVEEIELMIKVITTLYGG